MDDASERVYLVPESISGYNYLPASNATLPTQIGYLSLLSGSFQLLNGKLTGALPTELGKLSLLSQVDLFGNSFEGSLPTELGQLGSENGLSVFDLTSYGQIECGVPTEVGVMAAWSWNPSRYVPVSTHSTYACNFILF